MTVGIIALPLAIGFAIASGATPAQGLWTAIVGGLIVSLLGGSRFQIAGPTGAFVPVLAAIVAVHGYTALGLATMMAGAMLVVMGVLRLGTLLKYVPHPVVAGFTAGIAVIIFLGQLPEFLGLGFKPPEHAPELVLELFRRLGGIQIQTVLVGGTTFAIVMLWPRVSRRVPGSLLAIGAATAWVAAMGWEVQTLGSKFGGVPSGWPVWQLPEISLGRLHELMVPAFTIAALGGIESLLSATVADSMADTRHNSDQELIAQGVANLCTPLIGGFAVTGAIARTAANLRSGARTPVSGVVHSVVLLIFVMLAASWARLIPMAALAAVLMAVALRMGEWKNFKEVWRASRTDFWVLMLAFGLTVVFDLTIGVGAGLCMAAVLFLRRMEEISRVKLLTAENDPEYTGVNTVRGKPVPPDVVLFRVEGPLFFAVAEKLERALRGLQSRPRVLILRMRHVPLMDSTGLKAMETAWERMHREGVRLVITAIQPQPMKLMYESGLAERIGLENFRADIDDALASC